MSEQSSLSHFESGDPPQTDQYECGICGRSFDSVKGRGSHIGKVHSDDEIRADLVSELQALANRLERTPGKREMNQDGRYCAKTYRDMFDSWNEALNQAGLKINATYNIDKSDLIDELQRLADELGQTPTKRDMNQEGAYSERPYHDKFGSWNRAVRAAGLEIRREVNLSESDLLNQLTRLADDLGRAPTQSDMKQQGAYSENPYQNQFGSWNKAVRAAGLEICIESNIAKSDLIDELQKLADELGRTPTSHDMNQEGAYSERPYHDKFGSWNRAVRAAGLEIRREMNVTESEYLDELTRLAGDLGRAPTGREMNQRGAYSVTVYTDRFDSWNKALREAGLDPNNVYVPDHLDHKVRSTYEEEIADILLDEDIEYEYEPESSVFEYGTDRTYTPDFVTDQYVIEVKGYVYRNEVEKAEIAIEQLIKKQYVVIQDNGSELPADIHIQWDEREEVRELF